MATKLFRKTMLIIVSALMIAAFTGTGIAHAAYLAGPVKSWSNEGRTYQGQSWFFGVSNMVSAEQTVVCKTHAAQSGHMGVIARLYESDAIFQSGKWTYNQGTFPAGNSFYTSHIWDPVGSIMGVWHAEGRSSAWSTTHQRYLEYPTGQTYRVQLPDEVILPPLANSPEEAVEPDYIEAIATNGERGLVSASELEIAEEMASTPEQADEFMRERTAQASDQLRMALNEETGIENGISTEEATELYVSLTTKGEQDAISILKQFSNDTSSPTIEDKLEKAISVASDRMTTYISVYSIDHKTVIGQFPVCGF